MRTKPFVLGCIPDDVVLIHGLNTENPVRDDRLEQRFLTGVDRRSRRHQLSGRLDTRLSREKNDDSNSHVRASMAACGERSVRLEKH